MNTDKQIEYMSKLLDQINPVLSDPDSDNFIGIEELSKDDNLTDFFHVIATRLPQLIYAKLTGEEVDPLAFNAIATRLIFQDNQLKHG